jgi:protein TonB
VVASDYPSKAIRQKREGDVIFSLAVDNTGHPKNCSVTTSSGHADIDRATCAALMKRAHFIPAKNYEGEPIDAVFEHIIKWRLPK